jgi:hypothetical protein
MLGSRGEELGCENIFEKKLDKILLIGQDKDRVKNKGL